ncbi:MAG: hypothetical protein KDG51_11585, partial [Calditrichaeota bacterium]|nr:hypothetical protein [Calditrichota bacterium]
KNLFSVVRGVAVGGNLAYLADGNNLRIVDVSDPDNPFQVGALPVNGAMNLAVEGGLAYIAASNLGLRIIDVSNPAAPAETGFFDIPGAAVDV